MPELPTQRVPMSQRRCTCIYDPGYATRLMADPDCPARVLHKNPTDAEVDRYVTQQVEALEQW
jgi:hypothetical protein